VTAPDKALVVLGGRVRAYREAAGITQQVLADKIGYTRSSVANLEAGRQDISVSRLASLADALKVSPADLLPRGDGDTMRQLAAALAENWRLKAVLGSAQAALNVIHLDEPAGKD
jgi:transcriptional regulator with XRE-family HTH domain